VTVTFRNWWRTHPLRLKLRWEWKRLVGRLYGRCVACGNPMDQPRPAEACRRCQKMAELLTKRWLP
jgi:hypothetical protein